MKHAVVVGGTSGIGAGVVATLQRDGWKVTATGVSDAEVSAFKAEQPNASTVQLDVTRQADVDALFADLPALDGLVNCAGVLMREREYEIETFQRVIDINLTGTMRACLAAFPLLARSSQGAIVNTASMLSYFGGPLVPAYSASKGGVMQLTKALAGKWAADGIRVNAVAPGWIDTPLTETLQSDPARNDPIVGRTPMKRWGKTEEVGELVVWLLSDKARFVTGATYPVDGGYSAM
ncbi:MAG: SDR family oxidoreductase [Pseudomonadota bacterium]